ncbi:hypothetical protein LGK95_20630 [Clostridium algoriphilum]|uniref:hypothetical protein n=1 Tax=Clostridium algoriphilum TaxID=198347 RepID=UPI001CF5DE9C|nr:hypothetical protein [Clostridium algoriphilum]MCB2295872.1 hypothetical protein [Clostridium algoriphilum]
MGSWKNGYLIDECREYKRYYRKNRSLASKFPEICKYWDAENLVSPDEIEISSKGFKIYLLKCPTCGRKIFVNVWRSHEFSVFDIILDNKCSSCGEAIESP